ncbi:Rv1733c family protein [Actinacidiphila acidipaludis]|uniref:Uncharacterized protein n=1 Tax=Actinacidiphila acidipaludis TaxID=2873382 RepID=A0ABS7PZE2_9ACTN|nr:hypothetical protein [Streptomyces acidipaludis]MBY8876248.1 hypothetical protein [Streptomyces acidipaludis]
MRTTVRFWRWRRNPLKRGTDRAEAWSAVALTAVLAVGAPAAGVATGLGSAAAATPPAGWHTTTAVLTRQAPPSSYGYGTMQATGVRSDVRWTTPDGRTHHGLALVRPTSPAGSRVTVWLDRSGALRENPQDAAYVRARAVAFGMGAAGGTALVAGTGWACTKRYLDHRRSADLDREWARIGPEWGTAARG